MMARSMPLISMDHVTMIHSELTQLRRSSVYSFADSTEMANKRQLESHKALGEGAFLP